MKDEIKVGDYIRTSHGTIGKIKRIEFDQIDTSLKLYLFDKKRPDINIVDEVCIDKPYITNHSSEIIDLIEEGDYVNGYKVYGIEDIKDLTGKVFTVFKKDNSKIIRIWDEKDIKSIVTKEQFKSVEYVI